MSGGWRGSTRRVRLPDDWPERRTAVLLRDGHSCRIVEAAAMCGAYADQVDHINRGDDHDLTNLQAICRRHHAAKSSVEGNAARAAKHSTRRPAERHPGLI